MATKTVFQMDGAGLFAGTTEADESPREPGTYHLPRGCVEVAPPDTWPDDKWPRWRGGAWELIPRPIIPKQAEAQEQAGPIERLRAFLDENPDVALLLHTTQH